jgi:hypothetical protein
MPYSSPYAYAGNNPISYIDYNGEHPVIIIGGVAIGLVEFGLISTGVIVSGWFLTRDHHGRITLGDNLRDFFPRSRNNKKRDKRRNNHRKEMKAKNHTMSKGDGNMMGYQPEGDWRQTFTAAGMFAGTVIKTFDFWRYNKETINYYHDEFKTENLDSYYSELTSPNLRLVGGSIQPSSNPVLDPSKVPVPDIPTVIPPNGPKPLPMPEPNAPRPNVDPVPDKPVDPEHPFPIPLHMQ